MGQAEMVMAAATAICFSQFLRVGGWKGGFSKRGLHEMEICLGWEGGRVDFQKWGKQRW